MNGGRYLARVELDKVSFAVAMAIRQSLLRPLREYYYSLVVGAFVIGRYSIPACRANCRVLRPVDISRGRLKWKC